jgi:hypothetical protein
MFTASSDISLLKDDFDGLASSGAIPFDILFLF